MVPWYLTQPSATLASVCLLVFVVSLLKTKWFNLISSVGVRAASLNTALTAAVWVIVIEFFLIIVSLCAHETVKILPSDFLCQKKSSFAREGQGMNFSTNSFSWRLYHSVFLFLV